MSDLLDKAHADAVLALLTGALNPAIAVYDGKVPDPTPNVATNPWVLVYFDPGWPVDGAANSLDGNAVTYRLTFFTHSIAASAAGGPGGRRAGPRGAAERPPGHLGPILLADPLGRRHPDQPRRDARLPCDGQGRRLEAANRPRLSLGELTL
jgi:hypothetical protein